MCQNCGAAQSPADAQWLAEIDEIYAAYQIFHQSGGMDQHVVDPSNGQFSTRSRVLANNLSKTPSIPKAGRVIDIGCGTGVMLRALSYSKAWRLNGLDLDQRNLSLLKAIAGFETLYTCPAEELPGEFDLVTMVHSLEHFPEPVNVLREIRSKVAPGGVLFVQVPNAEANPFEYLVADHMIHFSPATLEKLVSRAGFRVDSLATDWVTKELSLIARPGTSPEVEAAVTTNVEQVTSQIAWLCHLVEDAQQESSGAPRFGLFGTSIAATWLCEALGSRVSFFVDEDTHRQGRTHMGRPIVSPTDAGRDSVVYIALVPQVARQVATRLKGLGLNYRVPRALDESTRVCD